MRGKIGCTQPRRVAAMSVAKRVVAEEFGCRLVRKKLVQRGTMSHKVCGPKWDKVVKRSIK